MADRNQIKPLPEKIDPLALHYARLATATMSGQTMEVFPDGAVCDRAVYDLFVAYGREPQREPSGSDTTREQP